MKVEDVPIQFREDFLKYFSEYFHEEEDGLAIDASDLEPCDGIAMCFDKMAYRMDEIYAEYINQSPEFRLAFYSAEYDAT